jgi:hypothetical protein
VELSALNLAPRYRAILEACEPFVVTYPGNHGALDLEPFGLRIPPERIYDPTRLHSRGVVDCLHHLDGFSFGGQEMLMPRWVLFDCGEFPGIVFGFGQRAEKLSEGLRRAYDVVAPERDDEFVPLSMWVAIRCAEEGAWFGHNLSSSNYTAKARPLPGLGTLTKVFGVRLAGVKRQYGATQWSSTSLNIHLALGSMELLGAYTPAHTHAETFTYRIDVEDQRLVAPLAPDWRRETEGGDRHVDADDPGAIRELHGEIEAGRRFRLVRVESRANVGQRLWLETLN